jgi:hypothetical protein
MASALIVLRHPWTYDYFPASTNPGGFELSHPYHEKPFPP